MMSLNCVSGLATTAIGADIKPMTDAHKGQKSIRIEYAQAWHLEALRTLSSDERILVSMKLQQRLGCCR